MTTPASRPEGASDAAVLARVPVLRGHGAGNDFVLLVDPDDRATGLAPDTVRRLCDRHLGVGGDGLIRVGGVPADGSLGDVDVAGAQVTMDYRNGDGSLAEMCGNGIRVTARVALEHGLVAPADHLQVATRAGVRAVSVDLDGSTFRAATVDMGPASTRAADIGLDPDAIDGTVRDFTLPGLDGVAAGQRWSGVSMGNPHAVGVVVDLDAVDLARLGPAVQAHDAFTEGVNVTLVEVLDDHHVRLRTWERGVGATLACGSGICATVAVVAAGGDVATDGAPVRVQVDGGVLWVLVDEGGRLHLTGPAEVVGRVHLDAAWLAALGDHPVD